MTTIKRTKIRNARRARSARNTEICEEVCRIVSGVLCLRKREKREKENGGWKSWRGAVILFLSFLRRFKKKTKKDVLGKEVFV